VRSLTTTLRLKLFPQVQYFPYGGINVESLTARELTVLKCIAAGMSTKAIAQELRIAFKTAACHRYRILGKLGANNTADLICRAIRRGLIDVGNSSRPRPAQHEHAQNVLVECRRRRIQLMEALNKQRRLLQFQQSVLLEFGREALKAIEPVRTTHTCTPTLIQ
jgi:DNA-binding CsgD family transcriptional regulator